MGNETLYDFIQRRRGELTAQRAPLLAQVEAIDTELRQLDAAEEGMKRSQALQAAVDRVKSVGAATLIAQLPARAPRGAIKRAVVRTLEQHPDGLDAMSILREINSRDGTEYERTSLSPQLSRLKADGIVALEGNVWRLIRDPLLPMQELEEDEPPETEGQ